jgi:hypothetical protein
MKKIHTLLLFVFALFLFQSAIAQKPQAGIKAGVNIAHLSGYDGNSRVSLHAGLYALHAFNSHWSVQAELLYSGEGQRYYPPEESRTIAMGFFNIPVMFRYALGKQFYLESGPQFGILAGATNKGEGEKIKTTRSYANTGFSWNAGFGIQTKGKMGVYARYSFGLTDMTRYNEFTDHSQVIQAGVSMRFK